MDVSAVIWKDNKCVRLLSTYVGVEPFASMNVAAGQPAKAARYNRKDRNYVQTDCPQLIREYNRHMGGVDLMDGLVGRYKIGAKTKDIMNRLFYHFIDIAVVNAYILQKRIYSEQCNDSSVDSATVEEWKPLELALFRRTLADSLMTYNSNPVRGRPSTTAAATSENRNSPVSLHGQKAKHQPPEIRYDGLNHWPIFFKKMWCKHCKKSQTNFSCSKCNLNLCLSSAKNFSREYHNKE